MQPDKAEQLSSIVAALTGYIDVVRSLELRETAVLLDMAKLDLQLKINAISDAELHALCEVIERQSTAPRGRRPSRLPRKLRAGKTRSAPTEPTSLPPARTKNDIMVPAPPRPARRARKVC